MPFKLTIVAKEESGIVHLLAEGEATTYDFSSLDKNLLAQVLGDDWVTKLILMDFERVRYVDSSAIGWLIGSQKQLRGSGGKLVLHSVPEQVKQVLDMLKIERVVPMAADVTAGRALLLDATSKSPVPGK